VSYASPIMDSMMIGMNSGNYDMFSANFSDTMKAAMDSEKFAQLSYMLQATIGKYMSKEGAANVDEADGYYRAVFTAHFTDDDPVSVTMSFRKGGGEHKVEGLWFSSKKLMGKT